MPYIQVTVAQKVAVGVYKGVTTSELDELAAETSASMTATHPDYALVHMPTVCDCCTDVRMAVEKMCVIHTAAFLSSLQTLSLHNKTDCCGFCSLPQG